ncbi:MAG: shikimate dehydrogenase [Oscillospiraceae bacterium]|nr:shikimate dehydrogenase [Oscillospiraceae bacterium]
MINPNYTLIGYPLGHSMSPWIHERLFSLFGKKGTYTLTEIAPEELAGKLPELKKLRGFNITIPYKTDILPYLDYLDETAQRYASVNCVAVTEDQKLHGYNTDCTGFLRSVQDMPLHGKVLLIGCGGVGRMMATEAVLHGADLTISEPDQTRAESLAQELQQKYPDAKIRLKNAKILEQEQETFDLLMNACPVGMYPKVDACPVGDALIQNSANVFDVIYNPTETQLIRKARSMGKNAVGGSAMLVWQAVRAHEIWNQETYNPEDIQKLIQDMEQEVNRLFPEK